MEEGMTRAERGWVEAGTILYFEQQPNKPHIPRRGEAFVSYEVVKAEAYDAMRAALEQVKKQLADHQEFQNDYIARMNMEAIDRKQQLAQATARIAELEERNSKMFQASMRLACDLMTQGVLQTSGITGLIADIKALKGPS